MGTPEFAVASLKALVSDGFNVVAVITSVDKPSGRGKKIKYSAVKEYALENNLRLFQPEKLKDETFVADLKSVNADLQVVVAFRMLPEVVWDMPSKGTINLHASLLPQYRGAAPINHAIINGETKTGLTTFFLDKQIDTGRIINQAEVEITNNDNAGSLHDRMMIKGADLILETVNEILEDDVKSIDQSTFMSNDVALKHAPKIFKDDCAINWNNSAKTVYDFIRGLSPYPGAYTTLKSTENSPIYIKVYSAETEIGMHSYEIGSVLWDKKEMKIAVTNGFVNLKEIQQSGKRRMRATDFLQGVNIESKYLAELI